MTAMSGPARHSLRRPLVAPLMVVFALLMACALVLGGCSTAGQQRAPGTAEGRSATAETSISTGADTDAEIQQAAADLLTRRERAVLAADRLVWDALWASPKETSAAEFASLTALPWAAFGHTDIRVDPTPVASSLTGGDGSEHRDVIATVVTRLDGESLDTSSAETFTLTRSDGQWLIGAHRGPGTAAAPWSIPGAAVASGDRSVVIGTAETTVLDSYTQLADRATDLVESTWPGTMPRIVVVAPATVAEYARLAGLSEATTPTQVAAITAGPIGEDGRAGADRIIVNPAAADRLTSNGMAFVVTHEIVHVVLRSRLPGNPPLWLSEGFADWVGHLQTALPAADIAADAVARVQDSGPPDGLPDASDFDPQQSTIAVGYQESWVLVDLLVQTHGLEKVQEFIVASTVVGEQDAAEKAADVAFASVLGTTRADVIQLWQARLWALAQRQ